MDMTVNIEKIKLPRPVLSAMFKRWLETYEASRREAVAGDLGHPELISKNAENLADWVGDTLDTIYTDAAAELIKQGYLHAYAAGLGKPLPTFTVGKDAPPPVKAHPARAVQTVQRDPETQEVIRTVTDYE